MKKQNLLLFGLLLLGQHVQASLTLERRAQNSCNNFTGFGNFETLAQRLKENNKRPFEIKAAFYGIDETYMDVTTILEPYAQRGIFVIPSYMNGFFGKDPISGKVKKLVIAYSSYQRGQEVISIPENGAHAFNGILPLGDTSQWQFINPALSTYPYWVHQKANLSATDTVTPPAEPAVIDLGQRVKDACQNFTGFTNYQGFAQRMKNNNKQPFAIKAAYYGNNTKYTDIVSILKPYANKGVFLIPSDMDAIFGDPAPGEPKRLVIGYTWKENGQIKEGGISLHIKGASSLNQHLPLGNPDQWQFSHPNLNSYPYWVDRKADLNRAYSPPTPTPTPEPTPVPAPIVLSLEQKAEQACNNFKGSISLQTLAERLKTNHKRSFVIKAAYYGIDETYIDVATILKPYANKGVFVIPQNMNSFFEKDPISGKFKKLVIAFTSYQSPQETARQEVVTIPENGFNTFKNRLPLGDPGQWQFSNSDLDSYPLWVHQKADLTRSSTPPAPESIPIPTPTVSTTAMIEQAKKTCKNFDQLLSLEDFVTEVQANNKKPFTVRAAYVGNDKSYQDVTSSLKSYADRGIFKIPNNLDANKKLVVAYQLEPTSAPYQNIILIGTDEYKALKTRIPLGNPDTWQFSDKSKESYPFWIDRDITFPALVASLEERVRIACDNFYMYGTPQSVAGTMRENQKQPFKLKLAYYGTDTDYQDMRSIIEQYTNRGLLVIPENIKWFLNDTSTVEKKLVYAYEYYVSDQFPDLQIVVSVSSENFYTTLNNTFSHGKPFEWQFSDAKKPTYPHWIHIPVDLSKRLGNYQAPAWLKNDGAFIVRLDFNTQDANTKFSELRQCIDQTHARLYVKEIYYKTKRFISGTNQSHEASFFADIKKTAATDEIAYQILQNINMTHSIPPTKEQIHGLIVGKEQFRKLENLGDVDSIFEIKIVLSIGTNKRISIWY